MTATRAAAALVLAAALAAAGCTDGDDGGEARHQYPSYDEADPSAVANVQETLAMSDPGAADVPDELAWTLAVETCVQLDDGEDPGDLVLFMADEGFTGELAAAVLVAAAFDVCPHHRQTVEDWST